MIISTHFTCTMWAGTMPGQCRDNDSVSSQEREVKGEVPQTSLSLEQIHKKQLEKTHWWNLEKEILLTQDLLHSTLQKHNLRIVDPNDFTSEQCVTQFQAAKLIKIFI